MKILVFEYITGGGFNKQELPDSLADEGSLMLSALLNNFSRLERYQVTVMLDWRLADTFNDDGVNTVIIRPEHDVCEEFVQLVCQADLIWPIAPEFDGILHNLCQTVELLGKVLLTSPATAVEIAGNKFDTYELLHLHHIPVVPTRMLGDNFSPGVWMVKPVDGVGCADSYVVSKQQEFESITLRKDRYIIQPHVQGATTSLSCLFKHGRGWLVCVNLQRFQRLDRRYQLTDIVVNHHADFAGYRQLVCRIARAMPQLWGYVGIDLIETDTQIWVLEINPRLTSSFAGIYEALGIDIAELVLQLLSGDPVLKPSRNNAVIVEINQENYAD